LHRFLILICTTLYNYCKFMTTSMIENNVKVEREISKQHKLSTPSKSYVLL